MRERGCEAADLLVRPDEDVEGRMLEPERHSTGIVIGASVRLASRLAPVFERIPNAVRRGAPAAPIAFNTGPDRSAAAAERWLSPKPASGGSPADRRGG